MVASSTLLDVSTAPLNNPRSFTFYCFLIIQLSSAHCLGYQRVGFFLSTELIASSPFTCSSEIAEASQVISVKYPVSVASKHQTAAKVDKPDKANSAYSQYRQGS